MNKTRYFLIALLLFCGNCLFGQPAPPAWGGGADLNDLSFGFSFHYITSYYKIDKTPGWRNPFKDNAGNQITDSLRSIGSPNELGFAVGFLARYRLTEHLEAKIAPSLNFADRSLIYVFNTPAQNTVKTVQSTVIDMPLLVKLKSDRIGDFRAYLVGGVKYSLAVGVNNKIDAGAALIDKIVKNNTGYGSYEAGIGCDIYFEFFKLSPEIKLSNSFGDILLHENQPYSSPIQKLTLHTLMFSLYFE